MSLTATLDADADQESVTFTYTIENPGDDPVELTFRSARQADVAVHRDDETVWRWSEGQMFAQVLQSVTLDPGERESFEFTWNTPSPGDYTAVATLNAVDVDARTETSFSV